MLPTPPTSFCSNESHPDFLAKGTRASAPDILPSPSSASLENVSHKSSSIDFLSLVLLSSAEDTIIAAHERAGSAAHDTILDAFYNGSPDGQIVRFDFDQHTFNRLLDGIAEWDDLQQFLNRYNAVGSDTEGSGHGT